MQKLLSLKASAGSGKTFSLANRYISLLLKGANPKEIVAITFTNKSAREMEERIIRYLRDIKKDENFLKKLVENTGMSEKEIIKKAPIILDKFLKSDIHITTIDSFIQKIARKFSYYGGFDIDFDVKSDNLEAVFSKFVDSLNDKEFEELVNFSKNEENILSFLESLYLIDKEIQSIEYGELRIENGELEELKLKIESLRDEILDLMDKCSNQVKDFIKNYEGLIFKPRFKSILDNGSIKYNRSHFNKCYSDILESKFFEYVELIKEYLYKKYLSKEAYILKTIFSLYSKYKNKKWEIKKKENYLDFKDIEHLVYEILVENHLDNQFLYFRLDSKINHILIDEFQDTSITQWRIIYPLVEEIKSGEGQNPFKTFFYVGDTKQAIYRFRGGSSFLFDYVYKSLKPDGMRQESLNTNYRSGEVIVDFVNKVFNLNEKANKDGGYVEIRENKVDEESSSKNYKRYDWRSNLKEVLEFMFEKGVRDKDIAILVYNNDDILEVADFIVENFNKKVVTSTTKEIINQESARAVISLMKFLYYKEKGKLFLFEFLTFVGKEFDENFDTQIKEDRPSKMIKEILDKYDLWDEATLKLLIYSMRYDTLIDFVEDIENCDEVLSSDIDGINILTIHKSKGLEFENVIVIDRMKKNSNRGIKLLYDYEGIELKNIRYKQSGMEILDDEYARTLTKEEELELKDKENVEYVAYTRAKNSLFILKNEKDSNFVKLQEYDGENILGKFSVEKKEEIKKDNKKFSLEINYYGKQGYKKEKEYKPNEYEAIYKGLAIHSLFEIEDEDYTLNRYGAFCNIKEVKEIYNRAKEYEEYKRLLNGQIYKELPFVAIKEDEKKEGIIDLMIENEEIIIIDYKSTKPDDERGYIQQLKFYIDNISKIKNKKTKGFIFYVDSLELKEIK
ncbi:RecB-like helicase [Caminibacter mediatlanticus]|uniref:DNA 3'-5' helicase n=1 Tax=Caminibacter mediatlanticus TB-2 TaxID=391592 RepID=A0AAI9AIZ8_9BACT|nr:RecB-like helicase [Caminibacter mediatlanticus]EDM24382.1 HELICASE [Caminibacter mediatlanticus TB-2]